MHDENLANVIVIRRSQIAWSKYKNQFDLQKPPLQIKFTNNSILDQLSGQKDRDNPLRLYRIKICWQIKTTWNDTLSLI